MFRFCLLVAIAVAGALPGGASAHTSTLGLGGWQVRSSASSDWLPVHPDDAGAPDSEINALLQNGACAHVFSTRMKDCFGSTDQWVAIGRFAMPVDSPALSAFDAEYVWNSNSPVSSLYCKPRHVTSHITLY